MEKLKSILSLIAAGAAVLGIFWSVITGMGLVISRADAASMIDSAVQVIASQAAQATLDEAKARQIADLRFQIELVTQKIVDLMNIPDHSAAQQFELAQLNKQLDSLNAQLAEQ